MTPLYMVFSQLFLLDSVSLGKPAWFTGLSPEWFKTHRCVTRERGTLRVLPEKEQGRAGRRQSEGGPWTPFCFAASVVFVIVRFLWVYLSQTDGNCKKAKSHQMEKNAPLLLLFLLSFHSSFLLKIFISNTPRNNFLLFFLKAIMIKLYNFLLLWSILE